MAKGVVFVATYSLVLVVLFIVFSYLMTTIDPNVEPRTGGINVSSTLPTIVTELPPAYREQKYSATSTPRNMSKKEYLLNISSHTRTPFHPSTPSYTQTTFYASTDNFKIDSQSTRRKESVIYGTTKTVRGDFCIEYTSCRHRFDEIATR